MPRVASQPVLFTPAVQATSSGAGAGERADLCLREFERLMATTD